MIGTPSRSFEVQKSIVLKGKEPWDQVDWISEQFGGVTQLRAQFQGHKLEGDRPAVKARSGVEK